MQQCWCLYKKAPWGLALTVHSRTHQIMFFPGSCPVRVTCLTDAQKFIQKVDPQRNQADRLIKPDINSDTNKFSWSGLFHMEKSWVVENIFFRVHFWQFKRVLSIFVHSYSDKFRKHWETLNSLLWCHKNGVNKIACSMSNQVQQKTSGCLKDGSKPGCLVAEQVQIHMVISL